LERLGIPILPAIVFNYITCVITGSVVQGGFPLTAASVKEPWFLWALLMGTFFILLFNLIGYTTQKLGVAVTSVANKLSLVIPFIFSIVLFNETASWMRIGGILVALLAVVLTCFPAKGKGGRADAKKSALLLLPAILFLGSGLLDTLVKFVEQTYLDDTNQNAYLIASFGTAATMGTVLLVISLMTSSDRFDPRSVVAGIAIGIPNYFSIWCLVHMLKEYTGNSSAAIPINNMGIVLFSSVAAWLLFRERLSGINWLGIFFALVAIALIAFG
jgi:drug/metabolite transporter (DMT)-like permease